MEVQRASKQQHLYFAAGQETYEDTAVEKQHIPNAFVPILHM